MAEAASRKSILEYLQSHAHASTKELAHELGITLSGVRYHLSLLAREGVVEEIGQPVMDKAERGRPSRYVRLSVVNRPHNLDRLARALIGLASSGSLNSGEPIERQLADLMTAGQARIASNLPKHLAGLIRNLNQQQYNSSWEARSQGPRILFHNCPYAAVWSDLPALCQMDRLILEKLLSSDVELVQFMFAENAESAVCVFQTHLRRSTPWTAV